MDVLLLKRACCLSALVVNSVTTAEENLIEEIVVIAHPLSGEGLSQASDVLQGEELHRKLASNIGATLAKQPGIHTAAFGNAVGRPVIHGLSGPRVRIMEDRIDTLDVSVSSGDHAVGVEPFIAERIEVLKGASTLLYGSGAIGGVVDVHTARIPHEVPGGKLSGGIETRFDDNTHGNTSALKLNSGSGHFAWHLDGTIKDGDDYQIPGFTASARQRSLEEGGQEDVRGVLPGSEFDSKSGAVGTSYLDDWGFVGLSISRIDADYGLPGAQEEGESRPTLELEQTRTDFELGVKDPVGVFSSLNLRVGHNDYEHQEIEPNGEVGTDFSNEAWEARVELVYDANNWTGAIGVQHTDKAFSATGEEAFIQPVDTTDSGVFWVGERAFDLFDLEVGVRLGRTEHDPSAGSTNAFSTYAASIGVVVPLSEHWQLGLVTDYSTRAPVAEELYADGPHLVTGTFERGNRSIANERAGNLSATIQYHGDIWSANVTGYYTRFSDFIYQQATGEEEDGLAVSEYQQDDATYFGVDAEVSTRLVVWDEGELRVKAIFDFVAAEVDVSGNDNLPRTPPMRYGIGFESRWGRLNATIDYLHVDEQDNVADLERATDAYDDLSAYIGVEMLVSDRGLLNLFLRGKNLTDDEQRIHTSFINEFAPAPGRTVEVGARWVF